MYLYLILYSCPSIKVLTLLCNFSRILNEKRNVQTQVSGYVELYD